MHMGSFVFPWATWDSSSHTRIVGETHLRENDKESWEQVEQTWLDQELNGYKKGKLDKQTKVEENVPLKPKHNLQTLASYDLSNGDRSQLQPIY